MLGDLQRIVDAVAQRVGRAALIEDSHQLVVAYSSHAEPMDDVRRESILSRHTSPEVMTWFRAHGVHRIRSPLRTPAAPELGLLPRVCLPIVHRDLLLGFLWFIDADGTMSDQDIRAAGEAAGEASRLLHRAGLLGDLASQREAEAARALLSDVAETRERAAKELLEDGLVLEDGPVLALAVQPTGDEAFDEPARSAVEHALVLTRRWYGDRAALHLMRRDHGLLLLTGRTPPHRSAAKVARHLGDTLDAVRRRLPGVTPTVIGLGEAYPRLADAVGSYREAVRTARVAARLPDLGEVASWSSLGVYRAVSLLDEQRLDARAVHPGLLRLLHTDGGQVLVETLETYLDLAGNAHATAERLQLHRTTLYYRLQRVEQLAGTNLKDGTERLCLHLALKMARLTSTLRQ
jgi:PucR-like helix-turn-helix protein/diguanylate cyclase with GGDEF domain